MKTCTKCNTAKPKSEFTVKNSAKDKLEPRCKSCISSIGKKYSADNREKILQDKKTYYIANKERTLDYGKRYYTEHKDSHAERNRQYRVSHVEETKTYQREYRKTHTNRLKQYHSEYRKTTKFKESIKAYRKLRPELVAQSKAKRRALELNADGSYTALELKAVLISQHCKCVYCDADLTIEFHADHIIPLSKGGTNYISNIQCLCPYHNRNKSDKDPVVYEESIGFART